jgi:cytochrome c oxidase cbb3-type subunit 3
MWPRIGLLCSLLFALPSACDRAPSPSTLREWTPVDHHSVDDGRQAGAQPAGRQAPAAKRNPEDNVAELVDITWRQQCTTCHGASGKGDGQMGPMVKAPDLTNGEWQATVSDANLAILIKTGKNRMPKFDLPAPVIAGLVARVRSLREPATESR